MPVGQHIGKALGLDHRLDHGSDRRMDHGAGARDRRIGLCVETHYNVLRSSYAVHFSSSVVHSAVPPRSRPAEAPQNLPGQHVFWLMVHLLHRSPDSARRASF